MLWRPGHLEQVGHHHVLACDAEVESVGPLNYTLDLLLVGLELFSEGKEAEVDHPRLQAKLLKLSRCLALADDRQLHEVGLSILGQHAREDLDEMVQEISSPVVERSVAGRFLKRVDRHLV